MDNLFFGVTCILVLLIKLWRIIEMANYYSSYRSSNEINIEDFARCVSKQQIVKIKCNYCGTSQKEDQEYCKSCGAGL